MTRSRLGPPEAGHLGPADNLMALLAGLYPSAIDPKTMPLDFRKDEIAGFTPQSIAPGLGNGFFGHPEASHPGIPLTGRQQGDLTFPAGCPDEGILTRLDLFHIDAWIRTFSHYSYRNGFLVR